MALFGWGKKKEKKKLEEGREAVIVKPAGLLVRQRPVIRVFVSSTFTDLKWERNALQQRVFPELERFCAERKFQFQAIDLRWGVSSEANLDHRTMRICFEELRRAQQVSPRPNFLVLLGNRYGWRPLPEEVYPDEFERLQQVATESERAVLSCWYRRDDNALNPVYLLQSRRQQLGDGKDYTDENVWQDVQKVLWDLINRAYPASILSTRFDKLVELDDPLPSAVRFQGSATEQEIWRGAFGIPDANEHVFAFIREIENLSEFDRPVEIRDFVDVNENGEIDRIPQGALSELKGFLKQRLGKNVYEFSGVRLQGRPADITRHHLDEFCDWMLTELKGIISQQIDEYWGTTGLEIPEGRKLELERQEHWRFGQERAPEESFVGREKELKKIADYISGASRRILVVYGPSGCGKTALLARAAQQAKDKEPIVRFIGLAPDSSDIRSLLRSLCQELRKRNQVSGSIPEEFNKLVEEFHQHLFLATSRKPLVLFLDALDQLSDTHQGRELEWLPIGDLPEHTKIIVSCLSDRPENDLAGKPYLKLKDRKIGEPEFLGLGVLPENEAQSLIFDRWLPQTGRRLNEKQRQMVRRLLTAETCRSPLYLRLLFDEIWLWHSYDPVPELPKDVSGLIGFLLNRLSLPANHGKTVESALAYLISARRGLSENEILEVLYADPDYKRYLQEIAQKTGHTLPDKPARVPVAIWSRLRYDLTPYLSEHSAPGGVVLNFYHRQMAECVRARYLDSAERRKGWQNRLGEYFEKRLVDERQADELPWLLMMIEDRDRLRECLLNIDRSVIMLRGDEQELRSCWVGLKEETTMGGKYLERFHHWAEKQTDKTRVSYTANVLGGFLRNSARHKEAEPLYRRALEILLNFTQTTGYQHPGLRVMVENFAILLSKLGKDESDIRKELIDLGKKYGLDISGMIPSLGPAIPPRLRPVIEQLLQTPEKTQEILAELARKDPALLIELIRWYQSQQKTH